MDDIKGWIIALLITSICTICIFTFATKLGEGYGKSPSDLFGNSTGFTLMNESINKSSTKATELKDRFLQDKGILALAGLVLLSIWSIIQDLFVGIISFVVIISGLVSNIIGLPPFVTGGILAVILVTLIFLGWRTIKQGQ